MPQKLKIAITGGIGAGKSEVSKIISGLGYNVVIADIIAKDILSNDSEVKSLIINKFGSKAYINGKPDFEYLAKNIFSDEKKVEIINSIIHPRTIKNIISKMELYLKKQCLAFMESALIFEAKREELFDYIIHVSSEDDKRIQRSLQSKGISADEVKKRMSHQLDEDTKKNKSDFIIDNNSTLEDLANKTKFVVSLLESISKG
jgi:dephospho-CoA kinase